MGSLLALLPHALHPQVAELPASTAALPDVPPGVEVQGVDRRFPFFARVDDVIGRLLDSEMGNLWTYKFPETFTFLKSYSICNVCGFGIHVDQFTINFQYKPGLTGTVKCGSCSAICR